MSKSRTVKIIVPLIIIILLSALTTLYLQKGRYHINKTQAKEGFIVMSTDKAFQDVVDDAEFAISERNFRITNTLKIGNAVKKRGNKDFPENDVILFCNIQYAEEMLTIDPSYVNYCPGQITVREEGDKIIISAPMVPLSFRNEKLDDLIKDVNRLVKEAVEFSAQDWQEVYD